MKDSSNAGLVSDVDQKLSKGIKNLKEFVVLAKIDAHNYQEINLEIIKHFTEFRKVPGVYVTLNKPFKTLEGFLESKEIDPRMIIFIDAVTKTSGGEVEKQENCLYIGSPQDLSDISLAMDQAVMAITSKVKFVFFDSLDTLLLYNQPGTVARFIHFLAGKMRTWQVEGIIVSLRKESNQELIDELMQFCDITLDFGGETH
jgi:hypothetical protein